LLKDAFPEGFPSINIIPTTETEIESIIHSLKSKNTSGYDEIRSKILKACSSVISRPLSHICNHSVHTGIFPGHLKISVIKPLYKKGDKASVTNYRPIALITTFSKVFEKVICSMLSHHIQMKNILVPEQFCFQKGIST
jgi:Notch-like protein